MRVHYFSLLLSIPGLAPGVGAAQAVPRTDVPRAGTVRVTFDAVVSAWDNEFTPAGRRPIGASLQVPQRSTVGAWPAEEIPPPEGFVVRA